ncbi:MAG: hypothetical protein CSA74_09310 [Rhodobacterales bacterium]|nr:MAG: hypothetical protein CSA74_09310 [Rhodobacterales bacterium]
MAYESLGAGALDYFPCRYGKSKLTFRGPRRRLDGRYFAVLGGNETYGKYVARPYADLAEELAGTKVVNLGIMNAGIDVYVGDQTVMEACAGARATVVQITGAQNMSNRFYAVHPRRNDRFLRASNLLRTIYREVDFSGFQFTRHLLGQLREIGEERFVMVEQELREAWVARMKTLLAAIESPVVLLWLADHGPDDAACNSLDGSDPLFVDREMLQEVMPYAFDMVEVVVSAEEIADGYHGLVYPEMESLTARGMLGTVAHDKAAMALVPVLNRLL